MKRRLLAVWICAAAPFAFAAEVNLPPAASIKIDFQKDVWPIFVQKCHSCHGPNNNSRACGSISGKMRCAAAIMDRDRPRQERRKQADPPSGRR